MTSRSRRQTRQLRAGAWAPEEHNEAVRRRKALIRIARSHAEIARQMGAIVRAFAGFAANVAEQIQRELALAADAEVARRIAWADRMSVLGFDMRDEHDALERGELVD